MIAPCRTIHTSHGSAIQPAVRLHGRLERPVHSTAAAEWIPAVWPSSAVSAAVPAAVPSTADADAPWVPTAATDTAEAAPGGHPTATEPAVYAHGPAPVSADVLAAAAIPAAIVQSVAVPTQSAAAIRTVAAAAITAAAAAATISTSSTTTALRPSSASTTIPAILQSAAVSTKPTSAAPTAPSAAKPCAVLLAISTAVCYAAAGRDTSTNADLDVLPPYVEPTGIKSERQTSAGPGAAHKYGWNGAARWYSRYVSKAECAAGSHATSVEAYTADSLT